MFSCQSLVVLLGLGVLGDRYIHEFYETIIVCHRSVNIDTNFDFPKS